MIIKEVEVRTYCNTVKCECGGSVKEIGRNWNLTPPMVTLKCLECSKEEDMDCNIFNVKYREMSEGKVE